MVTARTKILKHIWDNGGGYINSHGNIYLITKIGLVDANVYVDTTNITIEHTVHKGQNVAIVRGLVATRGKIYLSKILTGVCIDNHFYKPVNCRFTTKVLSNGVLNDTYIIGLVEEYTDEDKPKSKK